MSYAEEMFGLAGKTIAITGAGGVIAGAMAEALLKAGGNVSLWAHRKESADAAVMRLTGAGGTSGGSATSSGGGSAGGGADRLLALEADAADRISVRAALEKTEQKFGPINVLINCAGGNKGKSPFLDMDVALFEEVLRLNLIAGLVVPTQVVAARWIERKARGCIINLASMSSFVPLSGVWAYDAAKAAVDNLTMASA